MECVYQSIQGTPYQAYYVKGVYKHIDDDLHEKAGLEKGTIFIPICNVMNNSLSGSEVEENMDDDAVIDSYEVILPNEVRGYAYKIAPHMYNFFLQMKSTPIFLYHIHIHFSGYLF